MSATSQLVLLTGGIGAGKSVVARILAVMGFQVVDSDALARNIMDSDTVMRRRIAGEICAHAVDENGQLVRPALAAAVFGDAEKLQRLNGIVHPAVIQAIKNMLRVNDLPLIVETAIARESGLDKMADSVWYVTAPEDVRISRVMARNNLTEQQVRCRMASQNAEIPDNAVSIINDDTIALMPQILALTKQFVCNI